RILLIEDQADVREVVETALTENGYNVWEASTISEAEKLIAQQGEKFELIFSDIILPDGNGIDFAEKIFSKDSTIKILLSSGYTEEKSRPDAIAQKQFHFLQKPYPLNTMLEMVHRILSDSH
ncbi:MAG: response regulator, partial [Desulfobacteraceae bacterium]|nr:response regulator [Desulfobacteraceae bacterium]